MIKKAAIGLSRKAFIKNVLRVAVCCLLLFCFIYGIFNMLADGSAFSIFALSALLPASLFIFFVFVFILISWRIVIMSLNVKNWEEFDREVRIGSESAAEKIRFELKRYLFKEFVDKDSVYWLACSSVSISSFGQIILISLKSDSHGMGSLKISSRDLIPGLLVSQNKNIENVKTIISVFEKTS